MPRKILVLGGTGAMGVYLVPELARMGYKIDVVSLDNVQSGDSQITCIRANAKDDIDLNTLLSNSYDAVVDFLIYTTKEFSARHEMLLKNTGRLITCLCLYLRRHCLFLER